MSGNNLNGLRVILLRLKLVGLYVDLLLADPLSLNHPIDPTVELLFFLLQPLLDPFGLFSLLLDLDLDALLLELGLLVLALCYTHFLPEDPEGFLLLPQLTPMLTINLLYLLTHQ